MSNWPELLYAKIKESPAIWQKVNGNFYPELAPGNCAKPYVVWSQISTDGETAHDGPSGVDRIVVQFTVWDGSITKAMAIRRTLRTLLEGAQLRAPGEVNDRRSTAMLFSNELNTYDPTAKLHGAILELIFLTTNPTN